MSLPLLVMVVWVWPLVYVTICALLGRPETPRLAISHNTRSLTQFSLMQFLAIPLFTPHHFQRSCVKRRLLYRSSNRLLSGHSTQSFVVILRGRKEPGRTGRRPGGDTQNRRRETVRACMWQGAHRAQLSLS